jgi:signal transduction histidine kinase
MLALVRPDAQKHHVKLIEQFAPDLPFIAADAGQIQQALLNLFLNAVQAMPEGGALTVAAEPADHAVRIQIRDTGAGIPQENLTRIFQPFFTTKHRGTGLGLSITRNIIEKHRGTICVASAPGQGTVFTLVLPAAKELAHAPS